MSTSAATIDLDSIFVEIGEFGQFQIVNYVSLAAITVLGSVGYLSFLFTAAQLNYRYLKT